MAYVGEPFLHDIFVSYSHGSAADGAALLADWSENFVKALESELRVERRFRDSLRIFRDLDQRPDRGIDPMGSLTGQLQGDVGAAALLMVLMSPDYLASSWCGKERDWWASQQFEPNLATAQRVPVGFKAQERVAVVRMQDTHPEPWPALMTDAQGEPLLGFPFQRKIKEVTRPSGWRLAGDEFARAVLDDLLPVVGHVMARLDAIKERVDTWKNTRAEATKLGKDGGQTIYLHARAEQEQAWVRAAARLNERGFFVLPGEPEQVTSDAAKLQQAREERVNALCNCDALLLLGTENGRALDADMVVVGKHDRHSARSLSNKFLPCGLLDTVGPAIATPVRRANAQILQARWLDATSDDWPELVPPWLATQGAQVAQRT